MLKTNNLKIQKKIKKVCKYFMISKFKKNKELQIINKKN